MEKIKISVVIPYYEVDSGKAALLKRCVDSLNGYDELILVWNDGMGMTRALNKGCELARGEFIVIACDDIELVQGNLKDLCDPDAVTSPMTNGKKQDFWGTMWCMPRKVYEELGFCFDPRYADGVNYEDTDLWEEFKARQTPHYCVEKVNIKHPEPGRTLNLSEDRQRKIELNKRLFFEKWGFYR